MLMDEETCIAKGGNMFCKNYSSGTYLKRTIQVQLHWHHCKQSHHWFQDVVW